MRIRVSLHAFHPLADEASSSLDLEPYRVDMELNGVKKYMLHTWVLHQQSRNT